MCTVEDVMRKCSINGCPSDSKVHTDLKFFAFPSPDSSLYSKWLSLCEESAETILRLRKSFICSKHFHKHDIGKRFLCKGALPELFLSGSAGFDATVMSGDKKEVLEAKRGSLLVAGSHSKKHIANGKKDASENSFADYSAHSSDNLREDSMSSGCYQVKSECSEIKSECNDSMELCLNDDAVDIANNIEYTFIEADHTMEDVIGTTEIKSEKIDDDDDDVDAAITNAEAVTSEIKSESNDSTDFGSNDNDDVDAASTNDEVLSSDTTDEIIIDSYQQALDLLQSLEEYAVRKERYEAYGLLTTLENIFKNPKKDG